MPKSSKKVVLLIVEGISDEHLLAGRLKALYRNQNILFEVQQGDVLYQSYGQQTQPIKNIVGGIVTKFMSKRKFKQSDMLAVLHIVDTDGCLIADQDVIVDEGLQEHTFYQLDTIVVSSEQQKKNILHRNKQRSRNIHTMSTTRTIKKLNYSLYYFSRNVEHVLFDEQNPNDEDKFRMIEQFLHTLTLPLEEYLKEYLPNFAGEDLEERYRQSWLYIKQGKHSLERSTNVPLLFEYLQRANY